jgi:hypothetical protein
VYGEAGLLGDGKSGVPLLGGEKPKKR